MYPHIHTYLCNTIYSLPATAAVPAAAAAYDAAIAYDATAVVSAAAAVLFPAPGTQQHTATHSASCNTLRHASGPLQQQSY